MRASKHKEIVVTVKENPRRIEVTEGAYLLLRAESPRIIIHNPLASDRYSEGGSGEYVNNKEAMNRFEGKV